MATKKKPVVKKQSVLGKAKTTIKKPFVAVRAASRRYLARRPHRSLRLTKRRDYARSLKLPGYFAFTAYVNKTLGQNKKMIVLLVLIYSLLSFVLVGIASQDTYSTLGSSLNDASSEVFQGNFGELSKAGLLIGTAVTGSFSSTLTDTQQIYAVIITILVWLTTVWLLRNRLAGHKVKLRDGLYNSSAPLLSTLVVVLVLVVQLLPLALALIAYGAASSTGLLNGGVEAMLFWFVAAGLALISLYWITSTFIALIIVTLPGMYPFVALRTAGDVVIGRRMRILLRLLWMALVIGLTWVVVMVPVVLFDSWIKGLLPVINWIPLVPVVLLIVSSFSVVWSASYIYLLYRKVVADDAKPAF